jgi:hypothetical protein
MKYVQPRPFADPEAAARRLVELANGIEAVQDGRIYIERVKGAIRDRLSLSRRLLVKTVRFAAVRFACAL